MKITVICSFFSLLFVNSLTHLSSIKRMCMCVCVRESFLHIISLICCAISHCNSNKMPLLIVVESIKITFQFICTISLPYRSNSLIFNRILLSLIILFDCFDCLYLLFSFYCCIYRNTLIHIGGMFVGELIACSSAILDILLQDTKYKKSNIAKPL